MSILNKSKLVGHLDNKVTIISVFKEYITKQDKETAQNLSNWLKANSHPIERNSQKYSIIAFDPNIRDLRINVPAKISKIHDEVNYGFRMYKWMAKPKEYPKRHEMPCSYRYKYITSKTLAKRSATLYALNDYELSKYLMDWLFNKFGVHIKIF